MRKDGFTIIELIIAIALIATLSAIAVPSYINITNKAKYEADNASMVILNEATIAYANMNELTDGDIFDGISTNDDRMQKLVDETYLSELVNPAQKDASFEWIVSDQLWSVTGGLELDEEEGEFDDYLKWESGTKYAKGTYLVHNDKLYFSRNKTKKEPGTHKVWQQVTDQWVKLNIYKKNDTILHNGKEYKALKNSTGKDPETKHKHWVLIK